MSKYFISNEKKMSQLGILIGENVKTPLVIYLLGDLGVGKTHITKGIAKGLGFFEDITSPTFNLINEYHSENFTLYHLDLYRLNSSNEVYDLGIEDFIDHEKSLVVIEWAEKIIPDCLTENYLKLELFHEKSGRSISFDFGKCDYLKGEIDKFVNSRD